MFQASFHSIVTLRASWYAPPDTGVSSLRRVAFESLRQNVLRIKIIGQYEFALDFKLSRERSKKTEEVFLVGSRESEGKSKSPQALFLLPAFSFGEAKENADGQLQICTVYQPFERLLETPEASPMRGSCRRRRLMRWTAPRRRKCPPPHPSRLAPCHLPLIGEGFGAQKTENLPAKRCSLTSSGCTFYLQQIF